MGQWEYQIFKGAASAGDQIWLAAIFLSVAETLTLLLIHPKPIKGDWNGSGMHANFSNGAMREQGGEELFKKICEEFGKNIDRHISVYGADNNQRLTGLHETQSIDKFSYGVSDRGASIRIPVGTIQDDGKVASKIVVQHRMVILTELQLQSSKLRKKHSLSLLVLPILKKAMGHSIAFFIFFFINYEFVFIVLIKEALHKSMCFVGRVWFFYFHLQPKLLPLPGFYFAVFLFF